MSTPVTISDQYTGAVEPGGDAARRRVPGATIVKVSVGPMDNNVYVVSDDSGRTLLIDAANEPERILDVARQVGGIEAIVTTHRHPDHWFALADVREALDVPSIAGVNDVEGIEAPVDRTLADGERLVVGELNLDVIELIGHTPGSVALALTDDDGTVHLFSGDCLFPGGVGKTGDADAFTSLLDGVEEKVFDRYGDDTVVYPGHGKDTTLGTERPHLEEWRTRGW
ncbi:MBL fold metallo-hydrolase [Tsukamurella sp. 8F]|uniref:MBL fold metallo-hydrolase n=1 Tax=unclassified Tsukamurella TaxID=2633480 RepID=UPI0023B9972D|nr:MULTISPECIES: MBL fold metallo-hydrolase [unclassified Tsukamurella]MDF0528724.1 MBL fold metallo-hydrolase [Tsukamurella sp. 8J]MDF0585686.1 MBL fold metallo-hydrolase [Tsukamurella sp. 8F]